ncbi:MAG: glycosyltransferase [Pyrinomonadaceae bacterium]|nr:glycosyltransferase [Blastocatellia bacterium]MCW5956834.1 glycosyltransferase [Pyrinomonadaceae bacterium]
MSDKDPKISVIIPTKNRAEMVRRFLPSLAEQATMEPYEIIVVDNGSTDSTIEVVTELSSNWPFIRLITESKPGSAAACHAGAIAAKAPLIMFVDDDMLAVPEFISEHLRSHRENVNACVLGRVVSAESNHPFERMLAYIFDGGRQTLIKGEPVAVDYWSGNASLSRATYLEMGGYDQVFSSLGYGKDIDFGFRLLERGVNLVYAANAVTYHHFSERFPERLRKAYRSGQAYGYVKSNYPDLPLPELASANTLIPGSLIVPFSRLFAAVIEPFDRGTGRPIMPLAYVYDLALRYETMRGLTDYKTGKISFELPVDTGATSI